MRPRHSTHSLPAFPIYSAAFVSSTALVLGGGGGASRSGIKNKLRLYELDETRNLTLRDEYELGKGEDAPMSMAAHFESSTIACGINSELENLENGENENCRSFAVKDSKISLLSIQKSLPSTDPEDYQKVTVFSSTGRLLAVAGSHDMSLLAYPSLEPIADIVHTEHEIYDVTMSETSLVIVTTLQLLVFNLPDPAAAKGKARESDETPEGKQEHIGALKQIRVVNIPSLAMAGSKFRVARFDPSNDGQMFTVINASTPRTNKSTKTIRCSYISKWNISKWTLERTRKVGDRNITAFDISPSGRFLGFGSSNLEIALWDTKYLSPLVTILKAHELPVTAIKFNTTSTLLVSGSADNSVRVVNVPQQTRTSYWTVVVLILTILIVLIAYMLQMQLASTIKWR